MDEENNLIIIKGKDQTRNVSSYERTNHSVQVTYENSPQPYHYRNDDVVILQHRKTFVITDQMAVFHDGYPFFHVTRVQDFGAMVKVHFANGSSKVYDRKHIRIKHNGVQSPNSRRTMEYWRALSKLVKPEGDWGQPEAFLTREFAKLSYVHPDSVLSHYLNAAPIASDSSGESFCIFPFKYNLSQKQALQQALCSTISIIEGPPGTGKTQTILNILANLTIMQGKKVAVVSGNNAAVDNVREKLEREGYHFFAAGLGNQENKEHFFANLPDWNVAGWQSELPEVEMVIRIKALDRQIHRLMETEREAAMLKQELSAYLLEQEHFEHFYARTEVQDLGKLSLYRQTPERVLEFMRDSFLAVKRGNEQKLLHKFKLFFKHGFTRFKLLEHQEMDVMLNYQRQFYVGKIERLTKQISALEQKLEARSYQQLMKEHQQYSAKLFRHKLHKKYHRLSKVQCNEKTYKQTRNFQLFIERYPIVLSTTDSLRNSVPANYLFDYCIIDESSQVDLLTGALALSCCKRAIIVGDTKQLPHIVDKGIEATVGSEASGGIHEAYDYFRHNLLSSMLALYQESIPKVMLREHYRCRPQIIQFCNIKYYKGELIVFTHAAEADEPPLLIYKTAPGNHMRNGEQGKFNQRELDVIEREVLLGLAETAAGHADIGFATPYRRQADKASRQFHKDMESDTIHKYQGREKPVMVMSTVLDQTKSGKLGMRFVNDPCMINVAVSRAQNQFILVTDEKVFYKYGNEIGDLMRYMEYSTLDSNIVESEVISIFDLLYREYSDKLRSFRERAKRFKSSKYESENLMHALLEQILQEPPYNGFYLANQVLLMNLFPNLDGLDEEERSFIKHRASVDFVIYYQFDKSPALAIEVDGFAFHENNPAQLQRDKKKERIFEKFGLALHRFPTTGSGEEFRLRELLKMHLSEKLETTSPVTSG